MVNVMPQQDLWYCWLLIFWCSHWNFRFFQTFRNFVGSFTKPHLISVRLAFPTWPGSNHLEVFSRSATTLGWMHVSRSRIENWAVERWDGHGHGMGCFERRRFAAESVNVVSKQIDPKLMNWQLWKGIYMNFSFVGVSILIRSENLKGLEILGWWIWGWLILPLPIGFHIPSGHVWCVKLRGGGIRSTEPHFERVFSRFQRMRGCSRSFPATSVDTFGPSQGRMVLPWRLSNSWIVCIGLWDRKTLEWWKRRAAQDGVIGGPCLTASRCYSTLNASSQAVAQSLTRSKKQGNEHTGSSTWIRSKIIEQQNVSYKFWCGNKRFHQIFTPDGGTTPGTPSLSLWNSDPIWSNRIQGVMIVRHLIVSNCIAWLQCSQ